MEELWKTMGNLCHDSLSPGQESNPELSEYEAEQFTTTFGLSTGSRHFGV